MICREKSSLHATQCRRHKGNTEQKIVDFSVCTNSENSSTKHQSNYWISFTFLNKVYGRPSPPKIQGCQIDQQIQRWFKDQL